MTFFLLAVSLSIHASAVPEAPVLLDQLKTLVEWNSGSANKDGVGSVQKWIGERLRGLGFKTESRADRMLVGVREGKSTRTITFIMHADTVFEPSSPFQHLEIQKDIARGPGVIDDKGGVVVALEGLRRYLAGGPPAYTLRVISSSNEEVGSPQSTDALTEFGRDAWLVLGFEPAGDGGSIVESRRGNRWYDVTVLGKEAHAGRNHKDGINACATLAQKIGAITRLTDYAKDVTVSVGHMDGGQDKFNIVCGKARAKIDTRFSRLEDRDRLHARIETILKRADVPGAMTSFALANDCPPFAATAKSKPFVARYLTAIEGVEKRKVKAIHSGGSADSNYLSGSNAVVIDGLGPVGGGMHTAEEFVEISSLETRAAALHHFLKDLPRE